MTLRILIRHEDPSAVINYGGAHVTTYRTIDIEAPEVEAALRKDPRDPSSISIVGVEIISADKPIE